MKDPRGRRRYVSLLRKRTKSNWRNLRSSSSTENLKPLLLKHRMRLRRKSSFQASKLPRSLRSSDTRNHGIKVRSPLHSFESPETLTKKGKISRLSERSIAKTSNPPVAHDEREKGEAFVVNRRITRGMDGEETKMTMTMDASRGTKLEGCHGENIEKQGKRLKRAGSKISAKVEENMETDNASYKAKLRLKENVSIENNEDKCVHQVADSAVPRDGSLSIGKLDSNETPKSSRQAQALLKSLRKQKKLLLGGGVITRQKASLRAEVQPPLEAKRKTNLSQQTQGNHFPNTMHHGDEGGAHGVERKPKGLFSSRGLADEFKDRLYNGDAQQSAHTALDQATNVELRPEDLRKGGSRFALSEKRTLSGLDDPRQIDSGEECLSLVRSPETQAIEQGPVGTTELSKDSALKLRRSKRKRSPTGSVNLTEHRAPQSGFKGGRAQIEDAGLQDALIIEQESDVLLGVKFTLAHKVAENETGAKLDVFKVDLTSKSCLVATNPLETGGRQMRPRPLDLEQPLLVLVEGLDEDYYELDGGSFYRMLQQQQQELNSPFVSQAKSNGGNRKGLFALDATGEKAESIVIPSFRSSTEPEDSLQHPTLPYVLPDLYIKAKSTIENRQAEYDMDEEDEEWLNRYNQSMSPSSTFCVDQFEKIIDLLENKAADASGINLIADSVEEDQESASEECWICNGGENSAKNLVYECASCHIRVHQSCYGIKKGFRNEKKRRKWNCKKCEAIAEGKVPADISCSLCCKQGGALKPSTEPHRWAHVVCGLYTNETYFVDPDAMEPIDGLNAADVRAKRQRRQCCLCGVREGSAERCSVPGCKRVFHVSCGVTQGASFELQHSNHQVTSVRVYCPKHALEAYEAAKGKSSEGEQETSSQKSFSQKDNTSAAEKVLKAGKGSETPPIRKGRRKEATSQRKDLGLGASDHSKDNREMLNDQDNLGSFTETDCVRESKEKVNSRLVKGTVMNSMSDKEACAVLDESGLPDLSSNVMEGIYMYWVSKREKQGGPLLHRIQQEHAAKQFGIFNADDEGGPATDPVSDVSLLNRSAVDMKVVAARQQLRRLRELTVLVVQRERLKLDIFSLEREILKVSLEALKATGISQTCSSCKISHFSLACAVCNKAICMSCLTKGSKYSSWRDFHKRVKFVCHDCEEQNIQMHIELTCKPCGSWGEDGIAGSSMMCAWNEVSGSGATMVNAANKKPFILLPRLECSHQDKLATQAFWKQTDHKTALVWDLLKNPT